MKNFTMEEKDEIARGYLAGGSTEKQLTILAELNACTKNDIRRVLHLPESLPTQKAPRGARGSYGKDTVQALCKAVLVEGKTLEEAEEAFGVPHTTAKNWVYQARKKQASFGVDAKLRQGETSDAHDGAARVEAPTQPMKTIAGKERLTSGIGRMHTGLEGLNLFYACFADMLDGTDKQHLDACFARAKAYTAGAEAAARMLEDAPAE